MGSERFGKFLGQAVMLFLLALTGYFLFDCAYAFLVRGDRFGAFASLMACMVFGGLASCFFLFLYLGDFVSDWIDRIMMPKQYLRKAPPLISPVEALIKQVRYEEALRRLNDMIAEHPEYPVLWRIRFDLLRGNLDREEEAMAGVERYFMRPERLRSPENCKLLFRYCESAADTGKMREARLIMQAELKRHPRCYSAYEKRQMKNYLESTATSPAAPPK